MRDNLQTITMGGGCFWCLEAIFYQIRGVQRVVSGYMGGNVPGTPTYREVSSGLTGHAEVVQITFNESIISYADVLQIFMANHDPTISNANKNLGKYGSQYRSVIFYHDEAQKAVSKKLIKELKASYDNPIVTEIASAKIFYEAESDHQNYYANNTKAAYCTAIILPKLETLKQQFAEKLK